MGVFAREGMWCKKCPEMINQRLCFPDDNSVVASLRCLIAARLITRPWYLPFPNICVGLNGDLRLIPVSLVHRQLLTSVTSVGRETRRAKIQSSGYLLAFIAFLPADWSRVKKEKTNLLEGCLPAFFATVTWSLIVFLCVYNESKSVFVCSGACVFVCRVMLTVLRRI